MKYNVGQKVYVCVSGAPFYGLVGTIDNIISNCSNQAYSVTFNKALTTNDVGQIYYFLEEEVQLANKKDDPLYNYLIGMLQ